MTTTLAEKLEALLDKYIDDCETGHDNPADVIWAAAQIALDEACNVILADEVNTCTSCRMHAAQTIRAIKVLP